MTKGRYKKLITEKCKEVGTYKPAFDNVIETLADILEQRDKVKKKYVADGENPVNEYTNKAGATNKSKNPLLLLWDELNKSALAYWRDLGLTPAGLKKINENAMQVKKQSALDKALGELNDLI